MSQKYSPEVRGRALRMLDEAKSVHPHLVTAVREMSQACSEWARRRCAGGLAAARSELRRANEILKAVSVLFAQELDHPTT